MTNPTSNIRLGWAIGYALMLASLYTPLGPIVAHGLVIPLLVMYLTLDRNKFLIGFIVLSTILLFAGPVIGLLPFYAGLFMLPIAIVMGNIYQRGGTAARAIRSGAMMILLELLAVLLILYWNGVDIGQRFHDLLRDDAKMMSMMKSYFGGQEQLDSVVQMVSDMLPLFVIGFALYFATITHWIARKVLSRVWKPVPQVPPMSTWRLPKVLVFLYLITLILEWINPYHSGSTFAVLLINALPLLMFIFALQGIGLLFYWTEQRKWGKWLPIGAIVLMPLLLQIYSLVGIFDTAYPLRKRISPKE